MASQAVIVKALEADENPTYDEWEDELFSLWRQDFVMEHGLMARGVLQAKTALHDLLVPYRDHKYLDTKVTIREPKNRI